MLHKYGPRYSRSCLNKFIEDSDQLQEMGNLQALSSSRNPPPKVLLLGLDRAGKTTVLYKMKQIDLDSYIPTLGFNVETFQPIKNVSFTFWDIGAQNRLRPLWRKSYFVGCQGILYVVNSSEDSRFDEAKEELDWILESDEMVGVPLVVLANKQDLPQAATPSDVAMRLGLDKLRDRKWHIRGTSALLGDGIQEAVQELCALVKESQRTQK